MDLQKREIFLLKTMGLIRAFCLVFSEAGN